MAVKTLAGYYGSPVNLGNYAGYVQFLVTGTLSQGVFGNSNQTWTLTNAGNIAGSGVNLAGGTVTNSGVIEVSSTTFVAGVNMFLSTSSSAAGTVSNLGSIVASGSNRNGLNFRLPP
jgi:hypothetical protein